MGENSCKECGKGTVKPVILHNLRVFHKGEERVINTVTIGICDGCLEVHVDENEKARWIAECGQAD